MQPNPTPFLRVTDFKGSWTPGPSTMPFDGGQSTFDGDVIFLNMDRTIVEEALPPGLSLAPNTVAPLRHPVLVMLAHHASMRWILPGPGIPYPGDYQELILVVPFVQGKGGTQFHNYVVRMYLDDELAIAIGNMYYGYGKKRSDIVRSSSTQPVRDFSASRRKCGLFAARCQSTGTWRSVALAKTTIPILSDMQSILAMPIVGRWDGSPYKPFVCSYWQWDYTNAELRPIQSTQKFIAPFADQMQHWVDMGSVPSVTAGAVGIRDLVWRMAFPPRKCIF